jgi:hypothetical protein
MAAVSMDAMIYSNNQPQCFSAESNVNCANCILVKEQLPSALLELKCARTIISLLRDDINKGNAPETTKFPKPSPPCELSGYEQAGDKWIPVVRSCNKNKQPPTVTSMTTVQSHMSSNRFTPLTSLNESHADEVSLTCNCAWSSSTNSMKRKNTIQPSAGNKIPTIINGRVMNGGIKNPSWSIKNSSRVPGNKISKYDHKVKIIGDGHFKGSAARINQYLNTKFEVCSFIKPGASTNQLVHSQEMEFMCLGRKDVIVINGGTNGIGNNSTKRNGILVMMAQFMQKYNNTNIIAVNVPHRHDLAKDSRTNLEIQAFNAKLSRTAKSFKYVTLVEMDFNRRYFTRHGLHLNNAGKEWLAKLIATQIDKLINNINKIEPVIALNWKEETTNESFNVTDNHKPNLMSIEDDLSKVMIPPIQIHNSQGNMADSESLHRTSNRQTKAPITRSKDFLWQLQL